jgi:hypothetical protein
MKVTGNKTIAYFVDHPYSSIQSINAISSALKDYRVKIFTKHEVEDTFFDDVDCVCFAGGFGDSDRFDSALAQNKEAVTKFVKNGGKYLGICMGAYYAGSQYFNFLTDLDAVQYIKQKDSCAKRPHAKTIVVTWKGVTTKMFFYDGCSIVGNGNCETIATYRGNGDRMAIIQNNIGLIGCHPESTQYWYDIYSYMKNQYIDQRHLLQEFVYNLMNR